jgi:hypothetical protein
MQFLGCLHEAVGFFAPGFRLWCSTLYFRAVQLMVIPEVPLMAGHGWEACKAYSMLSAHCATVGIDHMAAGVKGSGDCSTSRAAKQPHD